MINFWKKVFVFSEKISIQLKYVFYMLIISLMKKAGLYAILSSVVFIAGCSFSNNKVDITETKFDVEACNKYFEVMDCILDNDSDASYSQAMRDSLREDVKMMQESWENLDESVLENTCNAELEKFSAIEDSLTEVGCSLK